MQAHSPGWWELYRWRRCRMICEGAICLWRAHFAAQVTVTMDFVCCVRDSLNTAEPGFTAEVHVAQLVEGYTEDPNALVLSRESAQGNVRTKVATCAPLAGQGSLTLTRVRSSATTIHNQ